MLADFQGATTRPPAVAGHFYAAHPARLRTQVLDLLPNSPVPLSVTPKALIAPHAGYDYSGRVAGVAFATLGNSAHIIRRVVMIGPAHYEYVRGIAAPTVDAFETPLGRVLVDAEACGEMGGLEILTRDDAPHVPEHALEVELPFLQTVLSSFRVVPLVVGDTAPEDVARLLCQLWGGPETLIVVSSDLSHYHSYEIARRLDRATAAAIERGDWASLGPNQACGSNAHRINQGSMPDLSPPETESDFYFVPADTPETAIIRIVELVKTRIPKRFGLDPIRDIQVLCPMNRGGVGARSLNIELQSVLNPAGDRKVERFGWTLAPGDKVMQIENDYEKEVYNGDIGMIDNVDPDAGELVVSFDGRPVTYGFGELDMLVPAYAATIHKSQGSEYPAVIIPVLTQHYPMLQRNLLYTGVTRGKRLVVLVGQRKAVAIAVRNVSGRRRWSKLAEWLQSDALTRSG